MAMQIDNRRPFTGFPESAPDFFVGLAANNDRDYWQANRETFEREVREPMTALVAALAPRFGALRLFRMNRDVRFGRDKSPYKTQQGAVGDRTEGGVWYLQLDADGLLVASGYHFLTRDQLARYRAMVADDRTGPELGRLIGVVAEDGLDVNGGVQTPLTGTPRGYPKDHPRIALLRWKGVVASQRIDDPERLGSPDLPDAVAGFWDAAAPLLALLDRHVCPPDPGDPGDRMSGMRPR